ncbi:MAG: Ig-like domain-containing protein [Rhizobiaceae bacterium]
MPGSLIQQLTSARIVGSTADDVLVGTDQGDEIGARQGNDQIFARGGNDTVFAGAGNDTVFAGSGADRVYAGSGNDQIFGGLDSDILYGADGNDTLYVGEGNDTVYAGPGNDLIGAGAGNDALYGGAGNDTIFSAAGNDSAFGGVGDDVLYGGDGNDTIRPGAGNDTVFGGAGTDIVVLSGLSTAYSWSGDGTVTTIGPDGTDVLNGVEYLKFDDTTVYIGPDNGGGNRPPVGVADSYTVEAGTTTLTVAETGVLANDSDPDNDSLTAVLGTGPANGTLALNADGSFSYTPNANFTGEDSFTYRPNDGTANGTPVTVAITVAVFNEPPVGTADSITVNEDGSATTVDGGATSLLANDSDPDNDPLTAILVTNPANGTLTLNPNGTFSYTHNGSETTTDSFTYKVNDGTTDGNTVTVAINVTPVNDAPVGSPTATLGNGTEDVFYIVAAADLLAGFSDPDGGTLAVTGLASSQGSVSDNLDGSFTVDQPFNYNGPITLSYSVSDGQGGFTPATQSYTVDSAVDITRITSGANSYNYDLVISEDGSTVAFGSEASNLVPGQTDDNGNTRDIFVYDVATGATINITQAGDSWSNAPVISEDGSTVAFQSEASNLVPGQTDANGNTRDIFVYDVATGAITNITQAGGGFSYLPVISADGSTVAFTSGASDLVPGQTDANGTDVIFVYDVATGAITYITEAGNNFSAHPVISAVGSTIAFLSQASNLVPGQTDANGFTTDIFVYDVTTSNITNITQAGNGGSGAAIISADGSTVVFVSAASNLIPGQTDHNGSTQDIFVYDVETGEIINITQAGNLGSYAPVISADGSTITFTSTASNLIPGHTDDNGFTQDIFVYDVATGTITNITQAGNDNSNAPVISADGSTIAFVSNASNLVPNDANGNTQDIYVYDVATGDITNITEAGNSSNFTPDISADGSIGAFISSASNLTPDQTAAPFGDFHLFDM